MKTFTPAIIEKDIERFENEFRAAMRSEVWLINIASSYILRTRGKRIRPIIIMLSAGVAGGITDATYRGAVMVELLHTATLLHDDVVDGAEIRRNVFSVNALWKNKFSILFGDYMLSRGLLLALESSDTKFLHVIAECVRQMTESEIRQVVASRRLNVTEADYFGIISGKTASLFAAGCQIGAVSAQKANEKAENALKQYGTYLGIAFQIQDDILDFVGSSKKMGKQVGIDIKEKKLTLPFIYALEKSRLSVKREMLKIVRTGNKSSKDIDKVIGFVVNSGGIEYATSVGKQYLERASQAIACMEMSHYVNELSLLAMKLFDRVN